MHAKQRQCSFIESVQYGFQFSKAYAGEKLSQIRESLWYAKELTKEKTWNTLTNKEPFSELLLTQLITPGFRPDTNHNKLIRASAKNRILYESVLKVRQGVDASIALYSGVMKSLTWRPWVLHTSRKGDSIATKSFFLLRSTMTPLARLFLPFGELIPAKLEGPTAPIFEKMANKPDYQPTAKEIRDLKEFKVYEKFIELQRFRISTKSGRHLHAARKAIHYAVMVMLLSSVMLVMNLDLNVRNQEIMSIQRYFENERLDPGQISIIQETVPFPHTAVQIGSMIFSPGQRYITVSTPAEYMRSKDIYNIAKARGDIKETKGCYPDRQRGDKNQNELSWSEYALSLTAKTIGASIDLVKDTVGCIGSQLYRISGWEKQPRSMYVTTLNVGEKKARKIKNYFLNQVNKEYANNTMVWDCASEALYAIDPENKIKLKRFFDASPGGVTQAFAAMKTLNAGPYHVESVRLVTAERHQDKNFHLIRNSWISLLETKLFTHLFLFNQIQRTSVDMSSTPEERRWHTEEYDRWLRRQETDARTFIKSSEQRDRYLDPITEDKLDVYRDILENKDIDATRKNDFIQTQIKPFMAQQVKFHKQQSQSVNLYPDERVNHQIRSEIFQELLQQLK